MSSGLLTEVQCQSKRLRKGSKGRGQEEEECGDSRRVSSSCRLPGQVGERRTDVFWLDGCLSAWLLCGHAGGMVIAVFVLGSLYM